MMQAVRTDVPTRRLVEQIRAIRGEDGAGVPWDRVWGLYKVEQRRSIAERSEANRRQALEKLIQWVGKNTTCGTINDFTRTHAAMFFEWLLGSGRSNKTANNIKGDLSAVWSVVLVRAGLQENVWRVVRAAENNSRHGRAFADAEVSAIFRVADAEGDQWGEACRIALYTGLRQGDIYALRAEHVQDGIIVLPPGKTRRSSGMVVAVPVHREIARLVDDLLKQNEGWLLPTFRRSLEQDRKLFSKLLRRAKIKAAGAHLSFHCFRHTFRTRLTAAGVPEEVVRRLGGWTTDIAEVYNHDLESLRRAVDALT